MNQASHYKSSSASQILASQNIIITSNVASWTSIFLSDPMNLDAGHAQWYAPAGSDKQREHFTKELCFNCSHKKHLHKNYSTNLYSKIQQAVIINLSKNVSNVLTKEIYVLSVNKKVKLSDTHVFLSIKNK